MIKIIKSDIPAEAAGAALSELLEENKDKPVFLLLSGGSAFELLQFVPEMCFGSTQTIAMLDERYGVTPENRNFSAFEKTTFCKNAGKAGVSIVDTRETPDESLEETARQFEELLKNWAQENKNGTIIATMGIGQDGHTAGIMPYPEDAEKFRTLFEGESWAVGYDAGSKNEFSRRITVTNAFLRNRVNHAIVYAVGDHKKEALKKIAAKDGSLAETPARIMKEMKNAVIFTNIA
ncbi:6-phosphogluconolactonase [bacterium]|nr:6-phosphogluconolactonase [bacterium]